MTGAGSRTAEIRRLARADGESAARLLFGLLRDLFGIEARSIRFNHDQYSLNSLNGFLEAGSEDFFFKFHQEEGEEAMSGEYYRADILANAGLPVDRPVHVSALPGEQILLYRRRSDPRFSDVLRQLDLEPDNEAEEQALRAERELSEKLLAVYRATLHPVTAEEVAAEPIHRLFHERLIDPRTGAMPGGRYAGFYIGRTVRFPDLELAWDDFAKARFVINGRRYGSTVGELFAAAGERLRPERLADAGGVTAHGDAHNANVWYEQNGGSPRLVLFDPAFAGRNVPTLLAEVKTTFHNIFAHPLWLYDPAEATQRYFARATYSSGTLAVETDWELSRIRRGLLEVKALQLWRPLLRELKHRAMLPEDWRRVVRLALFLCPALVMNLRAGASSHTPASSLIAFSVAVMAGSEPLDGTDMISRFLDAIDPDQPGARRLA
ncbi:hypothetical protein [Chelativorans sp.]|uniref:hypothetical protein n=1 Tax=Chelativorans sp. TaxID=2203393 RepID=UPI002811DE1E|nr:hypothetical protein [Chelativorans sp.]